MNLLSSDFGRPISMGDANDLFKSLYNFKRRQEIVQSLGTIQDAELRRTALRFFTAEEFGFIFTKNNLTDILKTLNDNKDTALVIFSGLRTSAQQIKPTLMGFIYQEKNENFEVLGKNGVEHPGAIRVLSENIPTSVQSSSIIPNLFQ